MGREHEGALLAWAAPCTRLPLPFRALPGVWGLGASVSPALHQGQCLAHECFPLQASVTRTESPAQSMKQVPGSLWYQHRVLGICTNAKFVLSLLGGPGNGPSSLCKATRIVRRGLGVE